MPIILKIPNSDNFYISYSGKLTKKEDHSDIEIAALTHAEYPYWNISFSGDWFSISCHCLMAEMFIPNPNKFPIVNHKDGNKFNWEINNLEWVTYSENVLHAHRTGLVSTTTNMTTVHNICELIDLQQTNKCISDLFGVSIQTVSDIRNGRRHRQISQYYEFSNKYL